jgi:hypothetical protein
MAMPRKQAWGFILQLNNPVVFSINLRYLQFTEVINSKHIHKPLYNVLRKHFIFEYYK